MIDRNIKKALQLLSMQIHCQHSLNPRGNQKIRNELGGDGNAGLVLAVLARIPEKRDHRRDTSRARPAGGINQDQEFHEILIGRGARGLNDENVPTANVLVDLDKRFAIRKRTHRGIARRHAEVGTNVGHQAWVSRAGDDFHLEGVAKHGAWGAQRKLGRGIANILEFARFVLKGPRADRLV